MHHFVIHFLRTKCLLLQIHCKCIFLDSKDLLKKDMPCHFWSNFVKGLVALGSEPKNLKIES